MEDDNKNGITRRDRRYNIQFKTLEELANAILVFGGEGSEAGLSASIQETDRAFGGLSGVFIAVNTRLGGDSFAQKVARDAVEKLQGDRKSYHGDWDWDGPGPFHKATINASAKDDGTYSLSISAVRNEQAESRLAERVGAPLGFARSELERTYALADGADRFAIPLSDIEKIYQAAGQDFNAEDFFKTFNSPRFADGSTTYVESDTSSVLLAHGGDIDVRIGLTNWRTASNRHKRDEPDRDFEYRLENGHLTGPARVETTRVEDKSARRVVEKMSWDNDDMAIFTMEHDGDVYFVDPFSRGKRGGARRVETQPVYKEVAKPYAVGLEVNFMAAGGITYDKAIENHVLDLASRVETAWKNEVPAHATKPRRQRRKAPENRVSGPQ